MRPIECASLACILMLIGSAGLTWAQTSAVDETTAADVFRNARSAYDAEVSAYWTAVADARRRRFAKRARAELIIKEDYVLDQPPTYKGPPEPAYYRFDSVAGQWVKPVPTVDDFLRAAREEFAFEPLRPENYAIFKKLYARTASAHGITVDQAVGVYAFETGGAGKYDSQAGLLGPAPRKTPISTAVGYNQLLATNSIELLAEYGDEIILALNRSTDDGKQDGRLQAVQRMREFANSVPDTWAAHEALARTPKGWGVHALVLDSATGPLLQTLKLTTSIKFARRKGLSRELKPFELELMNLMGDGNGFDIALLPDELMEIIPTSNFFNRDGYAANPVVWQNNTVATLISAINKLISTASARSGSEELRQAFWSRTP